MLNQDQQQTKPIAPKAQVEVSINNEIKLDPKTPIPINYNGECFYVDRKTKYIPYPGKDDILPNLLLEARLISLTQNACIGSIAESLIGEGLIVVGNENPDKEFITWTESVNNENESLAEVFTNIADGERSQGNSFIQIVKGDLAGKKFLKIYTHSATDCRLGEEDPVTGFPKSVLVSKAFGKKRGNRRGFKATEYPLYDPHAIDKDSCWKKFDDGTFRTMIHFKNKVDGVDHYGLPASVAGLRNQVLEGKAAQFNIDNFENNMILGGMLIFKSGMTEEEAKENAKRIIVSHVGDGNTGRIAVVSSESGVDGVDFKPYNTQKEGSYIEFDKRNEEKIISANRWDAVLAGLSKAGSLGNGNTYIRAIWDVKEATLLKPLRKRLISKVLKHIADIYADVFEAKEVAGYQFDFKSSMPFSFLGDLDPTLFVKRNEARSWAGLTTDDKDKDVYLSDVKSTNKNVPDKSTTT